VNLSWTQVRALVWKELRQLRRSRGAIASATLLPLLMLVVVPLAQLGGFRAAASEQVVAAIQSNDVDGAVLARFADPMDLYTGVLLPLIVALTGVIVPAVATAYAVVTERERRSLDLLMALPVSVADVLVAKVLSVLVIALLVVVPLFLLDAAVLLALGVLDLGRVLLLFIVLLGAFTCSIGVTFVVTILARDFRTANNLSGLQVVPAMLLTPALMLTLPPVAGLLALAAALASVGLVALFIAYRWITFERYLQ
jgi:ABC-2 type transport system permease protein